MSKQLAEARDKTVCGSGKKNNRGSSGGTRNRVRISKKMKHTSEQAGKGYHSGKGWAVGPKAGKATSWEASVLQRRKGQVCRGEGGLLQSWGSWKEKKQTTLPPGGGQG